MNLVGLIAEEQMRNIPLTVITNPNGFHREVADVLADAFFREVHHLPSQPNCLIIPGDFTKEELKPYLPSGTTVEVVIGLENPTLPFQPPTF